MDRRLSPHPHWNGDTCVYIPSTNGGGCAYIFMGCGVSRTSVMAGSVFSTDVCGNDCGGCGVCTNSVVGPVANTDEYGCIIMLGCEVCTNSVAAPGANTCAYGCIFTECGASTILVSGSAFNTYEPGYTIASIPLPVPLPWLMLACAVSCVVFYTVSPSPANFARDVCAPCTFSSVLVIATLLKPSSNERVKQRFCKFPF